MALAVTGYRFSWVRLPLENENNTLEYIQFISFWCKNAKQTFFFFFSSELILYSCSCFFSTTLRNNFSLENLKCVCSSLLLHFLIFLLMCLCSNDAISPFVEKSVYLVPAEGLISPAGLEGQNTQGSFKSSSKSKRDNNCEKKFSIE